VEGIGSISTAKDRKLSDMSMEFIRSLTSFVNENRNPPSIPPYLGFDQCPILPPAKSLVDCVVKRWNHHVMDVEHWPNGMYFLKIMEGAKVGFFKFLKN